MMGLVFLLTFSFVRGQDPIPASMPSMVLSKGKGDAPGLLEIFVDIVCPDSKASHPIMMEMLKEFGDVISFRHALYPLPYHHNAYTANLAIKVVVG